MARPKPVGVVICDKCGLDWGKHVARAVGRDVRYADCVALLLVAQRGPAGPVGATGPMGAAGVSA